MGTQKAHSLTANYAFNMAYQVLLYAVPLVTTPYLSRVLAAAGIGRYSVAQSVVSCFVLAATLGTTLYGQRKIASLRGNPAAQATAFYEILALRLGTTALSLAVYGVAVLPLCPDRTLYLLAALELAAVGTDISWFFQGQENFGIIAGCNGACKLLSLALIFLLVKTPADLNRYVAVYCGVLLAGNLMQWAYLPRYLRGVRRAAGLRPWRHLRGALALFVAQLAIQVYTVLDKGMIALITRSDLQNGYYEQAQKLIRVLTALATALGVVMASRVAALWQAKNRPEKQAEAEAEIERLIQSSFRVVLCLAMPVAFGVALVAARFVPVFYGPGFEAVTPLLRVLGTLVVIIGCSNVIGIQYLIPTGREGVLTRSVMAGAAVNAALNLALIPRYQALGAAVASVAAEVCVTALQLYAVRRELRLRPLAGIAWHYLLCCLPMAVLGLVLGRVLSPGLPGLAVQILACAACYAAVLLLTRDAAAAAALARLNTLLSKGGNKR